MLVRIVIQVLMVVAVFTVTSGAQDEPKKTIQQVPMKATSPASGKEMYTNYCAVCHGPEGKGNGPAAAALKTPPTSIGRQTISAPNSAANGWTLSKARYVHGLEQSK